MAKNGANNKYSPGLCNIGSDERRKRFASAIFGVFFFVALLGFLVILNVPRPYYLFLFFPAYLAIIGYVEYSLGFCAYFGSMGVYNFGSFGERTRVNGATNRNKDALRASQVFLTALAVSLIIAFLFAIFPL